MDLQKFGEKVQKDLAHRKLELSRLAVAIQTPFTDQSQKNLMCRAAVVFTYAHWEGFVKNASSLYIRHINGQQIPVSKLRNCFQAAYVAGHFKRAQNSSKVSFLGEVLTSIDADREKIFSVSPDKYVDTESNLSSTVFQSLVTGLGLPYLDSYSTRQIFIDEKLVFGRNQVAHGELTSFSEVDAAERLNAVRDLLDTYSNQLLDAARNQIYVAS
ncbi:MAE_28990/MAE_18760 family HEPN-like nuclease [Streptomyces sp. NPDC058308]|uniref:MAE_28990/MAE_18760 family HEPN-like nuclease n=1 Tax=Streptomyces sp. NPDC058308 TaxID=3346440 RepID=UPI0036EA4827